MTWASPKDSPRMSSHYPRPLSWIVISVGLLALFLIFASSLLVSYPIGATVRGYFYGVNSYENLGPHDSSPLKNDVIDVHLDNSPDLVDRKSLPDLDKATNLDAPSSDSNEKTLPFSDSVSIEVPKSEEVKVPETSDAQSNVITSDGKPDVVNSGLLNQYNSSDVKGNATIDESVPVVSMNSSSDASATLNETLQHSSDSSSTVVPASVDAASNASYDSGYFSCLLSYTS